jgi:hypothetical protein
MPNFINFLYSNMVLGAPPGMEDRVQEINAFRGKEYITACLQLTPEELEEVNKTGGVIWLSMLSRAWPPVKVEAFVPAHNPVNIAIYGDEMISGGIVQVLSYLDLNLILLEVGLNEGSFMWREVNAGGHTNDGSVVNIFDLEYRETDGAGEESPVKGGRYLFGEPLEILGRLRDLPKLEPLKLLYPSLRDDHLVLMQKDKPPELSKEAKIITLN